MLAAVARSCRPYSKDFMLERMRLLDGVEGKVNFDDCIAVGTCNLLGLAEVSVLFLAQDELR